MENRVPSFILCFFLLLSLLLLPQAKAARNLVDIHSAEVKHDNHSPTKMEEHGTGTGTTSPVRSGTLDPAGKPKAGCGGRPGTPYTQCNPKPTPKSACGPYNKSACRSPSPGTTPSGGTINPGGKPAGCGRHTPGSPYSACNPPVKPKCNKYNKAACRSPGSNS